MKELYKKRAEKIVPKIFERKVDAKKSVAFEKVGDAPFGVKTIEKAEMQEVFQKGDKITLDFGEHLVGQLSFKMESVEGHIGEPIRLKFRFGEIPMELARDFSTYDGWISGSWLQEEIVNVDFPGNIALPRRYCFRFMEVTVLETVQKVKLSEFSVMHTTSADIENEQQYEILDSELAEIDRVSAKTLEDCMQSVYEDGPKRDRRLWSGDFRLQALADYYVFRNYELVKRCLYLFAACLTEGKYLPSCLYHYPELWSKKGSGFMDYAFLYTVSVGEYFEHSKDEVTARELFPIVKNQMELVISNLTEDGILTIPEDSNGFIDWADGLKKILPTHGVFLYALEKNIELAKTLGEFEIAGSWEKTLQKSRKAAYDLFFDGGKFVNTEEDNQYAVHGQVWMILGGVVGGDEGVNVIKKSFASKDSIKPVSPYMHHYVLEAMIKLQMFDEAKSYIKNYWGGMIKLGADTFWEVYVPDDLTVSPYNDAVINSFCHAWSCTPSYFIRKYFNK